MSEQNNDIVVLVKILLGVGAFATIFICGMNLSFLNYRQNNWGYLISTEKVEKNSMFVLIAVALAVILGIFWY